MSKTEKHESRHKTMYRSEGDSWRNGIFTERMPLCPENIGQEVLADGVVFVKLAFEDKILRQIVRDAPVAQSVAERIQTYVHQKVWKI
ncbi:MAG TPA: hypothetical protein DEG74_00515 [Clostridiales bacterium]|nr:hypothetical protein [Clostridiales bacterium]